MVGLIASVLTVIVVVTAAVICHHGAKRHGVASLDRLMPAVILTAWILCLLIWVSASVYLSTIKT